MSSIRKLVAAGIAGIGITIGIPVAAEAITNSPPSWLQFGHTHRYARCNGQGTVMEWPLHDRDVLVCKNGKIYHNGHLLHS